MSTKPFNRALRAYVTGALSEPGEHSRADLAQAFIAANPDLAQVMVARLAERQVGSLIKEMCDAEPDDQQMSLFAGLPAAIAVAPGAVKAIAHCLPEDIEIGEQHRKDNIASAREALTRYRRGKNAYLKARRDGETVGDTATRLGAQSRAS